MLYARRGPARVFAGVLGMALIGASLAARAAASDVCDRPVTPAPLDFTLEDVNGGSVTLADHEGDVILLDFWATWCAPCRVEIPYFIELYEEHRENGFVVLGVSVNDSVERLEPFIEELGMSYPVLLGKNEFELKDAFGPFYGFPTSFLITREGGICVRHTGLVSREQIEHEIEALL